MFVNLKNDAKIYALSAANPTESSWGTYCSPDDIIQGKHMNNCLGDLFSVKFLEHSDENDLTGVTLQEQFEIIRTATDQSHVMQWGDLSFNTDPVSNFVHRSSRSESKGFINLRKPLPNLRSFRKMFASVDSRLMKIKILMETHKRNQSPETQA